jgi:rod shape-determining protein MreC
MLVGKNHHLRRRAVVGLLLAASLTLLTLSFRQGSEGVIGAIQSATLEATAPFSSGASRVAQPFADAWSWTTGLVHARQRQAELERTLDEVGARQVELTQLREQNERLKALLAYKEESTFDAIAGRVVQQSPTSLSARVTVNLGRGDGVAIDDPVIAPAGDGAGLVGRIDHVTANWSTVLLLVDPESSVTAGVVDAGAWGVVEPSSGDPEELNLKLVPLSERVPQDAVVVTAGLRGGRGDRFDARLPADIPIGRITDVGQSETSQFHTIQVTPFVDFRDLGDVLVLRVDEP